MVKFSLRGVYGLLSVIVGVSILEIILIGIINPTLLTEESIATGLLAFLQLIFPQLLWISGSMVVMMLIMTYGREFKGTPLTVILIIVSIIGLGLNIAMFYWTHLLV
jgi:hypothetical protein